MTIKKRFGAWVRQHKATLFWITSAGMLVVEIFFLPGYQNLALIGLYTFFLTGLILIVKKRYRELIENPEIPALPLPVREENTGWRQSSRDDHETSTFSLPEILLKEFEYAKETADQAMDDRHTLVNYFLLSAGVVLASFGIMVSEEGGAKFAYRYEVLVGLSLLFNTVGWVYFMQVVRLRQAWCESARAMNHLKHVFVKNCGINFDLAKKCFRWNFETLPRAGKKMTVFYFSALLISIINSSVMALAGIIVIDLNLVRNSRPIPLGHFITSSCIGVFHLVFQMAMYTSLLEEKYKPKNAASQSQSKA